MLQAWRLASCRRVACGIRSCGGGGQGLLGPPHAHVYALDTLARVARASDCRQEPRLSHLWVYSISRRCRRFDRSTASRGTRTYIYHVSTIIM